ncbi:MAG: RsmB/NOP family class I SAM-dependent RNA methyltransferase, partial [Bacteroidetes bacterium]|nr:RsmB/NOP family class I SAM-dependent RNA methyltransferase [Bacteroidota bacterium]
MKFPSPFVSRIESQLQGESKLFFDSLQEDPPVSIRINPKKKIEFGEEKIPWCSTGFYLDKRPSFTLDPLFHAGCYYVQDSSSMFLEQVFLQLGLSDRKLLILDACAAPGGKSTHLASLMSEDSLLVSNEVIGSRITVLKENTIKWGYPNVLITNNDPSAFSSLENLFDVILVDAPCSGEGLFRKDHNAMEQWSESNCEISASRQQRILTALLPALKPGGLLIYSTCTFNPKENEENVKWLCENSGMECIELAINDDWGIKKVKDKNCSGYAFHPHHVKGEGLFISVLKKTEAAHPSLKMKVRSAQFAPIIKKFGTLERWIEDTDHKFALVQRDEMIIALKKEWLPLIEFLSGCLRLVHSGTCIAEL